VICTDCLGSYKSNYYSITTTTPLVRETREISSFVANRRLFWYKVLPFAMIYVLVTSQRITKVIFIRKLLNQGFLVLKLYSSLGKFNGRQDDMVNRYAVTNNHWYVPFVVITIWSFPHSWLVTCNTTGVTCGTGTTYPSGVHEFTPGFCVFHVTRSLNFCVMSCFVDRCLSFCPFSFCCLFFFDLRILITPLLSSKSS
jgi:hypothetical protein